MLWYGIICFVLAVPIGIYFTVVQGWQLLPLLLLGAFCILFYTTVILKNSFSGMVSRNRTGNTYRFWGLTSFRPDIILFPALIARCPSGFLVLNLLLVE